MPSSFSFRQGVYKRLTAAPRERLAPGPFADDYVGDNLLLRGVDDCDVVRVAIQYVKFPSVSGQDATCGTISGLDDLGFPGFDVDRQQLFPNALLLTYAHCSVGPKVTTVGTLPLVSKRLHDRTPDRIDQQQLRRRLGNYRNRAGLRVDSYTVRAAIVTERNFANLTPGEHVYDRDCVVSAGDVEVSLVRRERHLARPLPNWNARQSLAGRGYIHQVAWATQQRKIDWLRSVRERKQRYK